MLDEGDLDEFSRDHEDLGPNAPWSELNQANIRYKWRERGPKNSRLIQLAFHDCLRYQITFSAFSPLKSIFRI